MDDIRPINLDITINQKEYLCSVQSKKNLIMLSSNHWCGWWAIPRYQLAKDKLLER
jgi:hypothetical protein